MRTVNPSLKHSSSRDIASFLRILTRCCRKIIVSILEEGSRFWKQKKEKKTEIKECFDSRGLSSQLTPMNNLLYLTQGFFYTTHHTDKLLVWLSTSQNSLKDTSYIALMFNISFLSLQIFLCNKDIKLYTHTFEKQIFVTSSTQCSFFVSHPSSHNYILDTSTEFLDIFHDYVKCFFIEII